MIPHQENQIGSARWVVDVFFYFIFKKWMFEIVKNWISSRCELALPAWLMDFVFLFLFWTWSPHRPIFTHPTSCTTLHETNAEGVKCWIQNQFWVYFWWSLKLLNYTHCKLITQWCRKILSKSVWSSSLIRFSTFGNISYPSTVKKIRFFCLIT